MAACSQVDVAPARSFRVVVGIVLDRAIPSGTGTRSKGNAAACCAGVAEGAVVSAAVRDEGGSSRATDCCHHVPPGSSRQDAGRRSGAGNDAKQNPGDHSHGQAARRLPARGPSPPNPAVVHAHDDPDNMDTTDSARRIGCARLWGAAEAPLRPEIAARFAAGSLRS